MRRMVLGRTKTLEAYIDLIQNNPKELDALYSDALINVTSFFRNPEAFEALKAESISEDPCKP
jgi:two-component system CheB/CheR fusion protein